jgi:SAM-dependent methyltransferase
MSLPSLHGSSDKSAAVADAKDASGASRPSGVRITVIVQNRYAFDTEFVTGRQIKEKAGVPPGFALYRHVRGGNELIPDDAQVELHNGDHFFARPPSSAPWIGRSRNLVVLFGAAAGGAVVMVARHLCGAMGRRVPGGILIGNARLYDALSHRVLLGSLFEGIAADVAAVAPEKARVLEVGCGPGRLSILLARKHGLDVTGLDLDPAMIERARANTERSGSGDWRRPSFIVGDVTSLAFPDGSFDMVVSTLSMHHWADPAAGLAEIGRVLRPGRRALVWDFRAGRVPLHGHMPDPVERAQGSSLRVVSATPWRWPWRVTVTRRIELAR